jgi:hypothetical protein
MYFLLCPDEAIFISNVENHMLSGGFYLNCGVDVVSDVERPSINHPLSDVDESRSIHGLFVGGAYSTKRTTNSDTPVKLPI